MTKKTLLNISVEVNHTHFAHSCSYLPLIKSLTFDHFTNSMSSAVDVTTNGSNESSTSNVESKTVENKSETKNAALNSSPKTSNENSNDEKKDDGEASTITVTTGSKNKNSKYDQKALHREKLYRSFMKEPDVVIMQEGLTKFYKTPNVFYNPAMSTNRDVSIAAIETYGKLLRDEYSLKNKYFSGLKIFEGLSATGLRSIRYLQEIDTDLIDYVQINDISPTACELIDENLRLNNISSNGDCDSKAVVTCGDCNVMLMQHSLCENHHDLYDVIDLDPYGTATQFIDNSIIAIKDGGLLCITCTDVSCLCGNNIDACFKKYGAIPINDLVGKEHVCLVFMCLYVFCCFG